MKSGPDASRARKVSAPTPAAVGFSASSPLFGWYHGPAAPARNCAVVLCAPLHYESICSHRAYRKLALKLAELGFPTLRFDYAGTGDSPGTETEPGRVRAWIDSVHAAQVEARRLSGAAAVALVGVRTGALLALAAAGERDGVDALVLWAPVSGRNYLREVKAFNAGRSKALAAGVTAPEGEESAGFLITPETMTDLAAIEIAAGHRAPAPRALLLDRDDFPGDEKIFRRLEASGVALERREVPGFARLMTYPHLSVVPDQAWSEVSDYLCRLFPERTGLDQPLAEPRPYAARSAAGRAELREEAVRFDGQRLFGILGEPGTGAADMAQPTAVIFLTMASHHRIGPNRLHTRWARELAALGYATLRFDISGSGDSAPTLSGEENTPADQEQARDVSRAIDFLETRGYRRFVAVGICSGAYFGYYAALADPRLSGNFLVNPQRFEPEAPAAAPAGGSRTAEFKATSAYRRALFSPATWRRLWRGEINGRRILRELIRRIKSRLLSAGHKSDVLASFRKLSARGVHSQFVFAAEDVNIDYIERELGQGAARVRDPDHVQVIIVDGAEHTFGQMWAQARLGEILASWLKARFS